MLYIAVRLGYSFDDAQRIAFFTQVPDEVGEFSAVENYLDAKEEVLKNAGRARKKRVAQNRMQKNQPAMHALSGGGADEETKAAIQAALTAESSAELGFLLHRLGDSFSHRELDNPSRLYPTGRGHGSEGLGGHTPDTIQRRPELYLSYVRTVAEILAARKGADQSAINEIVRVLRTVTIAEKTDHWYRPRLGDDAELEEIAVARVRKPYSGIWPISRAPIGVSTGPSVSTRTDQ